MIFIGLPDDLNYHCQFYTLLNDFEHLYKLLNDFEHFYTSS